ncbi:hypothetical protein FGG08_000815 [Glutinoglossum americanum]|uniref:C2H2-type domain-containing protein n=1 Tax=Glutinoglossum americanum TaxID=1670608 RepID=A0A9P8I832_9PEZI|nr:hypothetical protein FGG08_000815 [Glutinoglossum americanum]
MACDQECLVTEREPVPSLQSSCDSNEIDPEIAAHKGTLEPGPFISPQELSEESPSSNIQESGNAQTGFALPNGQRPNTSSDSYGRRAEPPKDMDHGSEDAMETAQQTVEDAAEQNPRSETRIPSTYPSGPTPTKGLDCSKITSSNSSDRVLAQKSPKNDQDTEGSHLPDAVPTDVSSTIAAWSPEIRKEAASLTPRILSTLGIGREQTNSGPEAIVIGESPTDVSNKRLDASEDVQTENTYKLPPLNRSNRSGQIGHRMSSENMNISSGSGSPLNDRIMLQVEELLKFGLSNILSKRPQSVRFTGPTVGGNHGPIHAGRGKDIQCRFCKKVLPRDCDMNKHLKRHTRPYGCTFPNCNKLFGSKNDWKRHENTQHFQLEMWRCHEKDVTGKDCVKLFYRRETFQAHLRQHGITDPEKLREEARSRRIGRNGQGQFWCGFCKVPVPLKFRGLDAWDERFNHIGMHFARKQKIDEWVSVDSNVPKGDTWPERPKSPAEEPRETDGHEQESPKDEAPKDGNANVSRPPSEKPCTPNLSPSPTSTNGGQEPKSTDSVRYCVSYFLRRAHVQGLRFIIV